MPRVASDAVERFVDFVESTEHLSGGLGTVALEQAPAAMLQKRLRHAAAEREADVGSVLVEAVGLAVERAADRPPPIYIAGMGGSGSRWLAAMLGELPGAFDLEEAFLPGELAARIEPLPAVEQGVAIDCLHLCHAAARTGGPLGRLRDVRMVNSAVPTLEPRHRAWDPHCYGIHLLRDPRDQVACFAFRKPKFKRRLAPRASAEEYLVACAEENARNHAAMRRSPAEPDAICRYEELRESAAGVLQRLAAASGLRADSPTVGATARAHHAESMWRGEIPLRGDLSPAPNRGWRAETDERQKLLLHSRLAEVTTRAGYPMDDCTGRRLELAQGRRERRLRFQREGELGTLFVRRPGEGEGASWARFGEASGELTVEAGVELKLRVHEQAPATSVRSLGELPPDGLDSLCLAGNAALDEELLALCAASLSDLRELDLARTGVGAGWTGASESLRKLRGLCPPDGAMAR